MPKELESVGMDPGRGGLPPRTPQDADEFLENVDEVNALIDGLRSGKISAEYVDRKIKERDAESTQLEEERKKEAEEAERRKYENLSPEEQKKIKAKVDEMIAEKERRERARKAFHEYRAKMPEEKRRATDYDAWDLWTPSDDEDDPWMKYTPENPAFKAMEADIDRRHAAQVRARQTAHRRREDGNAAFRAGQFAEALRCYELGLEADKRSLELHGNAAMAALKCEMFVQCIDHASKACELAEFLLERPDHPTAIKCLQRRAAARLKLSHYKDALNDLSLAHQRDPSNGEIESQMKEANATYEEARKEKEVERGMRRAAQGIDGEVDGTDFHTLRELEKLCGEIGSDACDYARLEALVEVSERCRVFLRSGRGLHLLRLSRELELDGAHNLTGPLRVLRAACLNEANRETLARNGTLKHAVGFIARARRSTEKATDREAVSAALFLLHTCSATADPRARIIEALASDVEPDGAIAGLFAMLETDLANDDAGAKLAAAHALSLLGNCAVDAKARMALAKAVGKDAPGKIARVLRCGTPVLAERAAALLGNMCADGRMRADFAANERGISELCALLQKNEKNERGTRAPSAASPAGMGAGLPGLGARDADGKSDASTDLSPVGDSELVLNVLAALANVSVDAAAAATIGGAGAASRLVRLLSASDPLVAARAATVLSRIARDPSTARRMCGPGGSNGDGVAATIAKFVVRRLASDARDGAIEPAVRTLAVLANGGDVAARLALAEHAAGALVECVRRWDVVGDGAAGNAALAIGDLAREGDLLPRLAALEPVAPLLQVCHKRTGAAQKNAAIACARLATHSGMLETLKANNGLELIYRYVQP